MENCPHDSAVKDINNPKRVYCGDCYDSLEDCEEEEGFDDSE